MGLGVDLTVESGSFGLDSREWLGSAHGTQATRTVTIDCDDFIGQNIGGAVLAAGDFLPSGVKLGSADGVTFVRSMAAAVDGSEDAQGHLYSGVTLKAGRRIGVALYEHGKVRVSKLPAGAGDGANAPHIIYLP